MKNLLRTFTPVIFGVSFAFLAASASAAPQASCGSTSCYDYCDSSFVTLSGDTCTTTWDFNRSCYAADAYCSSSSGGGGSGSCGTISCYDYCTSSFVNVNGNSCTTTWDFNRGCYRADGDCN